MADLDDGAINKLAGNFSLKNSWSGVLTLDRGEFNRLGREFVRDGVREWDLGKPIIEGDLIRLPMGLKFSNGGIAIPGSHDDIGNKPNLVPNNGVIVGLKLLFPGIGTAPAGCTTMGVDNGTVSPNANFVSSTNGDTTTGSSTSRTIVAFSSAPTISSLTVSASGAFSQANVAFVIKRLFLSNAAAGTTDANGNLIAMTNVFTLDYTPFSSWSQSFTLNFVGAGS